MNIFALRASGREPIFNNGAFAGAAAARGSVDGFCTPTCKNPSDGPFADSKLTGYLAVAVALFPCNHHRGSHNRVGCHMASIRAEHTQPEHPAVLMEITSAAWKRAFVEYSRQKRDKRIQRSRSACWAARVLLKCRGKQSEHGIEDRAHWCVKTTTVSRTT